MMKIDLGGSIITVAHKNEVCGYCHGEGTQDVWDGGMTGEEMAEQGPEFFEDYMSGMYSKPCETCDGHRVVQVPNRDYIDADTLALIDEHDRDMEQWAAEQRAEAMYFGRF